MKKILQIILTVFFVFGICGIGFAAEKIIIEGSGDNQRLLRFLADVFQKKHPGKIIEVPESIGSSAGIKALENGKCDLARIARPLKNSEQELAISAKVFAFSPVVVVVSNNVKEIDNLSDEQFVNIYSGKVTSWSQLGGREAKIYVVNRDSGESCRTVLEKNIPGFKEIRLLVGEMVFDNLVVVKIITENKDTIAYTSMDAAKNAGLMILKLNGVYPSLENVRSGDYKLALPLGIVWKDGKLNGLAKDFVDFIFSAEAKNIIISNEGIPAGTN